MRWYCVLCFAASRLKNSTLRLLRARVTLMPSSRNTRSSGAGRKSGTTLGLPKGSSVYLIFALIDSLTFAPIARSKNPNDIGAVRKSCGEDAATHFAKAEVALFVRAVTSIQRYNAAWIGEGELS